MLANFYILAAKPSLKHRAGVRKVERERNKQNKIKLVCEVQYVFIKWRFVQHDSGFFFLLDSDPFQGRSTF